jgi:hypothetical protein
MLILISSLLAAALFGAASIRYGSDSRPGFDERPDGARFGALR